MIPTVILVEYFNDHIYKIIVDNIQHWIASVTTKLGIEKKYNIERWRGDIGNREADIRMHNAQDRGKRIHFAWYTFITGGTVIYNPWENPVYSDSEVEEIKKESPNGFFILRNQDEMIDLWKLERFFKEINPKVLHSELKVYSVTEDIAGTLDNAFLIEKGKYNVNGRFGLDIPETGIYIADLKTGSTVDKSVWNQLAPYSYCYQTMGFGIPKGAFVLHTGSEVKTGIPGLSTPFRSAEELKHDFIIYQKIADIWKERNPNYGPDLFSFPSLIKQGE